MIDERHPEDSAAAPTRRGPRHQLESVRFLLLVVALLPTLGMLALAVEDGQRLTERRDAARDLDHDTTRLLDLIDARTAASTEEVASSVIAIGVDLGVDAEQLGDLYDQDFVAQMEAARSALDATETIDELPEAAASLAAVRDLRSELDAGTVSFSELHEVSEALLQDLDAVWARDYRARVREATADDLPASVQESLQALDATYTVLSTGSERAVLTALIILGAASTTDRADLVVATGAYRAAASTFPGALGPEGAAAWQEHRGREDSQAFETVLDDTVAAWASGKPLPFRDDPGGFGDAYITGPTWALGLREVAQGAADDLRRIGSAQADDAADDLRVQVVLAVGVALLSLVAALLAARRLVGPVRALESAARQVREGRFDLPALEEGGPRELVDTARAFNEMASTLAAVEAHAVALADDIDAPVLSERLPGRTGRALQVALNRLRSSMQVAEVRRRELERAATHDSLTGLLNRAAAFEVVARDLLRVERDGGSVFALYVDLDGLKPINDVHGHAAGDDALRLAGEAIASATRASDVVARLGGDEFLVSGILVADHAEVEELAERVRVSVSHREVVCTTERIPLHCSIGVAVAGPGSSVAQLINEADGALLEAKRTGKDRVHWARGSQPGQRSAP